MSAALIDPVALFGVDPHPEDCCACCDEFCVGAEGKLLNGPRIEEPLYRIRTDGVEYLTDKRVAVRANAVGPLPADKRLYVTHEVRAGTWPAAPAKRPAAAEALAMPGILDRIDRAGITRHGVPVGASNSVHLNLGDTHVGWAASMSSDARTVGGEPLAWGLADLPLSACEVELELLSHRRDEWACPSCGTTWPFDADAGDEGDLAEGVTGPVCPNDMAWEVAGYEFPADRDKRLELLLGERGGS